MDLNQNKLLTIGEIVRSFAWLPADEITADSMSEAIKLRCPGEYSILVSFGEHDRVDLTFCFSDSAEAVIFKLRYLSGYNK